MGLRAEGQLYFMFPCQPFSLCLSSLNQRSKELSWSGKSHTQLKFRKALSVRKQEARFAFIYQIGREEEGNYTEALSNL